MLYFNRMKKFFILFIFVFSLSLFGLQKTSEAKGVPVWDISQDLKEYGLDTLTTIINSRLTDKLIESSINWANGGFDGEPGFINNWGDYLKGVEQDVFVGAFSFAEKAADEYMQNFCNLDCSANSPEKVEAEYQECLVINMGDPNGLCETLANAANTEYNQCMANSEQGAGTCQMLDLGAQAQSNYNAWNSGELDSYRLAAESIALVGGQKFNSEPLKALIEGQGETLSKLLGSKSEVENFKSDFSVGGIRGWIALADPHNYPLGQAKLVESALNKVSGEKVNVTVEDLQTPNKFLDRKWCLERDDDNNCTKEFTGTPGALVESKMKKAADSDPDRTMIGRELSDILAHALGKLTDGLLQMGFNKLTKSGSSAASTQPFQAAQFFTTGYQNEFDILGLGDISPSGSIISGGASGNQTPIFDPETGTFTPLRGGDGSLPYIGGPEDAVNTSWGDGPEIIIDLQNVLENSTNLVQNELTLLTEIEKTLRDGKDNVMKLDRCIPGPKFGWEDRLRDNLYLTGDSNDEESALDKLGLQETRRMANDSMVNIPGASQMRGTVNALLSQNGGNQFEEISDERNRKQTYLAILKNMKTSIQQDFNSYKGAIDSRLVIFEEDWNKLSDTEKIALFSIPERDENGDIIYVPIEVGSSGTIVINENQERPLYIMEKYYLFKPGETPASVFANNPDAVKKAVLSYSWDLWQRKKGEEPASGTTPNGITQKSNLRYQYYAMSKYLSTESDILDAEMKKDEVVQSNKTIADLLSDCVQFKAFSLNLNTPDGKNKVLASLANEPSLKLGALIGGMEVLRDDHGRVAFNLNTGNARTDQEIKNYVLQQKALQENNQASDFKTNIITNGVEESILGFDTVGEKAQYFEDFYEKDEDLWQPYYQFSNGIAEEQPQKSIATIFAYDFTTANWPRGGTGKGALYCRVVTSFDARGWSGNQGLPKCLKEWYSTSNVAYDLALMNIR